MTITITDEEIREALAETVNVIVDAVRAAQAGFETWRRLKPLERAGLLRKVAAVLRENAFELAMIDAANCGNPISEMQRDALIAAAQIDYYAGLATEVKGETLPMGEGVLNYTLREPYGVCARIMARKVREIVLVARNRGRLQKIAQTIKEDCGREADIFTEVSPGVRDADIIITATSSTGNIITADDRPATDGIVTVPSCSSAITAKFSRAA